MLAAFTLLGRSPALHDPFAPEQSVGLVLLQCKHNRGRRVVNVLGRAPSLSAGCQARPAVLNALHGGVELYRRRWSIETCFYEWALDRPAPRPKTINAHVIQFMALVLLKVLGGMLAFIKHQARPQTKWTVILTCRLVLAEALHDARG